MQIPQLSPEEKERLKNRSLLFCTPTRGDVCVEYVSSMVETQAVLNHYGINSGFFTVKSSIVSKARNLCVAEFLAGPFSDLIFIDSDTEWSYREVMRLLLLDKKVIGGVCRKKTEKVQWCCNFIDKKNAVVDKGAVEVKEVGTGFLMIRREIFEKIIEKHPEIKLKSDTDWLSPEGLDNYHAIFDFKIVDGKYRAEDYLFCDRVREVGERIWIDPEADLVHIGDYKYGGKLSEFMTPIIESDEGEKEE